MLDILHDYGIMLLIGQYQQGQLGGLALTVIMALLALIASFPLAVLIGLARTSTIAPVRNIAMGYTYVVRAIPLLLLIFWTPILGGLINEYSQAA